ncbi:Yip1 family protein [Streptomyces mesophilus]|uniref:Yip1 family protein n=1 Tax=Streptomyces mesophilus TaxID=1775132 RepID=UPI0033234D6F
MAGFRIGRGNRGNRPQSPRPQHDPQQPPYGQQQPYGRPAAPPYPQQQYPGGYPQQPGQQQWPQAGGHPGQGHGAHGEPEYFGDPYQQQRPPHDPYAPHNNPGHTQAFSVGEDPYSQGGTYRAGAAPAPIGPRLHWKQLLSGVVLRPNQTYLQMRDHTMWVPAVLVTFVYGLLAVFGFDGAREDAINATLATSVPIVLTTGVAIVLSAFVLGVVTHTVARQLGGDGAWQPTVGLSMLIMSLTDAPRLIFAMFLGGDAPLVQILGWATWIGAAALLTTMVSKSHDLPWPRALGASAIQLIAILSIIKLGTF